MNELRLHKLFKWVPFPIPSSLYTYNYFFSLLHLLLFPVLSFSSPLLSPLPSSPSLLSIQVLFCTEEGSWQYKWCYTNNKRQQHCGMHSHTHTHTEYTSICTWYRIVYVRALTYIRTTCYYIPFIWKTNFKICLYILHSSVHYTYIYISTSVLYTEYSKNEFISWLHTWHFCTCNIVSHVRVWSCTVLVVSVSFYRYMYCTHYMPICVTWCL